MFLQLVTCYMSYKYCSYLHTWPVSLIDHYIIKLALDQFDKHLMPNRNLLYLHNLQKMCGALWKYQGSAVACKIL